MHQPFYHSYTRNTTHVARAIARRNRTTTCICSCRVPALVGGTEVKPGQVTLGQDHQYLLGGTKSITTTKLQPPPTHTTITYNHHIHATPHNHHHAVQVA